jgi:hypothetical protein
MEERTTNALIVSDVAAVDAVLLRFLVIVPFKLNGSFRFSGHCIAYTPNVNLFTTL